MKKLICAALALALTACALSSCSRGGDTAPENDSAAGNYAPARTEALEGAHGEVDQSQALGLNDLPTLEPMETIDPSLLGFDDEFLSALDVTIDTDESGQPAKSVLNQTEVDAFDPNMYQFSALTDTALGFTFNYPSHWKNVPGIFTVCYREETEDGEFPARVSVTRKKMAHTVEGTVLNDELKAYVKTVAKQYDASTFQLGKANNADTLMGRVAISDTYLAYYGETEIKGFIIGTAIGMYVVVFHFCATYEEYTAMENMMRYMVGSVQVALTQ